MSLSVIVPAFNADPWLGECLRSLIRQECDEIIVVDDGSADETYALAESTGDDRVTVLRTEHRGLSAARQAGISVAGGAYLAFCDADDVVPDGAHATMTACLDETGSDLVTGAVLRLVDGELRPYQPRRVSRRATTLRTSPELTSDITVWNKVYRRSFWDGAGLGFTHEFYEDAPVVAEALARAERIDVISDVVYHWRITPGSITSRSSEPAMISRRIQSILDTRAVFHRFAPGVLPPIF